MLSGKQLKAKILGEKKAPAKCRGFSSNLDAVTDGMH
jgi:hypothetical protein